MNAKKDAHIIHMTKVAEQAAEKMHKVAKDQEKAFQKTAGDMQHAWFEGLDTLMNAQVSFFRMGMELQQQWMDMLFSTFRNKK